MSGYNCGTPSRAACTALKGSRYRALDGSILLWCKRCRKLTTNSENIADVHEHTIRVLHRAIEELEESVLSCRSREESSRLRACFGRTKILLECFFCFPPFEQRSDPSVILPNYFYHAAPAQLSCPSARTADHSSHRPPDSSSFPDALVNLMHGTKGSGPSHFVIPKKAKMKGKAVGQRRSIAPTRGVPPAVDDAPPSSLESGVGRGSGSMLGTEEDESEREVVDYGDGASDPPSADEQITSPESTPRGPETSAAMARRGHSASSGWKRFFRRSSGQGLL